MRMHQLPVTIVEHRAVSSARARNLIHDSSRSITSILSGAATSYNKPAPLPITHCGVDENGVEAYSATHLGSDSVFDDIHERAMYSRGLHVSISQSDEAGDSENLKLTREGPSHHNIECVTAGHTALEGRVPV